MNIIFKKISAKEMSEKGIEKYYYLNPMILVSFAVFLFMFSFSHYFRSYEALAEKFNCSSFKTQSEAQKYFNFTKDKRLDRDHDGSACEHLPKH